MKISIKAAVFSDKKPLNYYKYIEPSKKQNIECCWYVRGSKNIRCNIFFPKKQMFNDLGYPLRFLLKPLISKYTEDYMAQDIFGKHYTQNTMVAVYEPFPESIVVFKRPDKINDEH
tara:strand:+ start:209 stop:556 length:348 start_codon:yes stop_codon:yes gene_type:complete